MSETGSEIEVLRLFVSPGHNFFGRHGETAGDNPAVEVDELHCLAGRGLQGDRFLDHEEDYKGQITFFADEVHQALCLQFGVNQPPWVFRRNVITRGVDLNALIGRQFEIQGVKFAGVEECRPCDWMNEAFAPGAESAMRGRGGLRARILSNGILRRTVALPKDVARRSERHESS